MTGGPSKPAVQDEVHYNGGLDHCLLAAVMDVIGDSHETVLAVRDDADVVSNRHGVNYGTEPGTWHWPEP